MIYEETIKTLLENPTSNAVNGFLFQQAVDEATRTISLKDAHDLTLRGKWEPEKKEVIDAWFELREEERQARLENLVHHLKEINMIQSDVVAATVAVKNWHQSNPYEPTGIDKEAIRKVENEIECLNAARIEVHQVIKELSRKDIFSSEESYAAHEESEQLWCDR